MTEREIWQKPCTPAEIMERAARKDVRRQLGAMAARGRRLPADQLEDLASDVVLAIAERLATMAPDGSCFPNGAPLTLAALSGPLTAKASQLGLENPAYRRYTGRLVIRAQRPSKFRGQHKTVKQDEWKLPGVRPSVLDVILGKPGATRDGSKAVKCGASRRYVKPQPRFLPVVRRGVTAPEGWGWGYKGVLEPGTDYYLAVKGASPRWVGPSLEESKEALRALLNA